MNRYVSPILFSADVGDSTSRTRPVYALKTASELKFSERWLQDAIEQNPDLVVEACREAGLTDEAWWFWAREFPVDSWRIDLLLVSETGRVAIVETKLSYNPELRRSVLAQLLEYAVSLPEVDAPLPGHPPRLARGLAPVFTTVPPALHARGASP